jgi:hypothetical protein
MESLNVELFLFLLFLGITARVGFSLLEAFVKIILFWCGVVSPTPNHQPAGPGLHIYIPWRLGDPVIPPGIEYPF